MASAIGIAPAVMINRMVHEAAVPQPAQLAEVARLAMELRQAQADEQARNPNPDSAARLVANGAEVDRLI
jgi:hypothetical protein